MSGARTLPMQDDLATIREGMRSVVTRFGDDHRLDRDDTANPLVNSTGAMAEHWWLGIRRQLRQRFGDRPAGRSVDDGLRSFRPLVAAGVVTRSTAIDNTYIKIRRAAFAATAGEPSATTNSDTAAVTSSRTPSVD